MDSQSNSVLTEELLAAAEDLCRAARGSGVTMATLYHGGSGGSARLEQARSAKETKKWPI
ncbi:MAG: hypothetical protein ACLGXA_16890 [Acidobacteriota bacterium]